jgi:hypothetical protein
VVWELKKRRFPMIPKRKLTIISVSRQLNPFWERYRLPKNVNWQREAGSYDILFFFLTGLSQTFSFFGSVHCTPNQHCHMGQFVAPQPLL